MKRFILLLGISALLNGCSLVSCNSVFPHFRWYWSYEAKECRREHEQEEQWRKNYQRTNVVVKPTQ